MTKEFLEEITFTGVILKTGEKFHFKLNQIPVFIMKYGYTSDLEILNALGEVMVSTFGTFLNKCDSKVRELIIEELVSYQTFEKELPELTLL